MATKFEQLFGVTARNSDDGAYIMYDHTLGKFVFRDIDADEILERASEDGDLPDTLTTQIKDRIDLGNVSLRKVVDGGSF